MVKTVLHQKYHFRFHPLCLQGFAMEMQFKVMYRKYHFASQRYFP